MRKHRLRHQNMKQHNTSLVTIFRTQTHRMAGHFARLDDAHIVARTLHCRALRWWRRQHQEREDNGAKWCGVRRREQDYQLSYGRSTRDPPECSRTCGWKATGQIRGKQVNRNMHCNAAWRRNGADQDQHNSADIAARS